MPGADMNGVPLPQRLVRAVGESPWSERVAVAQERVYGPVIGWARRSPFHTGALGHPVHPMFTDLTLGCWTSAGILDLAGGPQARRSATILVGAGLAAAVPTAIAGTSDWADMTGPERRIGAVHALGTDTAVFLFLGSLIARTRGRHALGVKLGLAGNAILAAAGFLGGHLALNRGTGRRTGAAD
ncbi:DUF2231 domain-containing protein [Arthrobacter sp. PM3]|uniref:DUF2231 domain-containing protein n=1 Tax=Arthrobacter sp. PM3 TaxID=2017685 RepID=UPI000E1088A4|nr:DUF2231 domain-containing protein [Arthrobacter sp. PM3]AXJ11344.1 hypothetical protein CFN17_18325 [Arthrobacter sp. PM3]